MLRHVISVLLIALAAAPATAAPITVYFAGVFTSENAVGAVAPMLLVNVVADTTKFSGSFQYDPSKADSNLNGQVGEYVDAVTNFSLTNLLLPNVTVTAGDAQVNDNLGGIDDRVRFDADLSRGAEIGYARVELLKTPPVLLNSDAANVPLNLADYTFGRLSLFLALPGGAEYRELFGRLTYLNLTPPPPDGTGTGSGSGSGSGSGTGNVPEPASLTLLGVAAMALAWRGRQR